MTLDKLMTLGFTVTGGQIDRGNVNYGVLTKDGPELTPEGQALAQELDAAAAPKRTRAKKGDDESS